MDAKVEADNSILAIKLNRLIYFITNNLGWKGDFSAFVLLKYYIKFVNYLFRMRFATL